MHSQRPSPSALGPAGMSLCRVVLDLAVAAGVTALISGDRDLLALQPQLTSLVILSPAEFARWLDATAQP
ncbi:MAG: hypothetical protein FJ051_07860 [Cyanobacteria bacterium M_surface_9_m1_291]|nr:hypothetical protein [Cyanobacteria bacterium M_surface_9_m1_291]